MDPLSSVSKFGGYAGQLANAAWSGNYTEITEKLKNKSFSWFAGKTGEAVGLALNVVPAVRLVQAGIVAAKVGFFVAKETVKFTCKKVTQMAQT